MGRRRQNDLGLPERVYPHHSGGFIYKPKVGRAVVLKAKTVLDAHVEHGKLSGQGVTVRVQTEAARGTLRSVIQHYREKDLKKLAPDTIEHYKLRLDKIDVALGDVHPARLKITDLNAFIAGVTDSNGERNGYISHFRSLYRIAVKKGLCERNIARDLERERRESRTRIPSLAVLERFKAAQGGYRKADPAWWGCYIDLKLLTGLRERDLIELPPIPLTVDTFTHEMSKSRRWRDSEGRRVGEKITIRVTEDVRTVLRRLYALKRPQSAARLLSNAYGRPFTPGSFLSAWRRAMKRYLASCGVTLPARGEPTKGLADHPLWFHEHDIRATVASADPQNAQRRLGHKYQSTTTIYLRELEGAAALDPVAPLSMRLLESLQEAANPSKNGENIHPFPKQKAE